MEYKFEEFYTKKFNATKKLINQFLEKTQLKGKWTYNNQSIQDPNQLLHKVTLEEFAEMCFKKGISAEKLDTKLEPKITPQERYDSVVFWKQNVIPFVKKLVEEEIENEKKSGAEVGTSEKLQMYESYLNLATEVYNSP